MKHARAQHVLLVLNQNIDQITLRICDDGRGFEACEVDGRHLGLQIMRERAKNIDAHLSISSHSGEGTEIVAIWPDASEES